MDTPETTAYNLTRRCLLVGDVVKGDFVSSIRKDWLLKLRPGSGIGLWMQPFRGLQAEEARNSIDLVYLDENCRVIEAVESFPARLVSASSPTAASVLALPSDSIHSSRTRAGDQLMIGPPGMVARQVELLPREAAESGAPVVELGAEEHPDRFGAGPRAMRPPERTQIADSSLTEDHSGHGQTKERLSLVAGAAAPKKKKNWLQRLFYEDPRIEPREPAPGLTASFWTVGMPQVYAIRDLNFTGMYAVTDERWYPGTTLRVTLTMADAGQPQRSRSITLAAKVVRWGNDGVAFEFVLQDRIDRKSKEPVPQDLVHSRELRSFLKVVGAARL
ncbi:MAG: hypothetical protein P4L26_00520 [Terracidiphilus sp.]|nr:hypothetical protein [Terracidiphilus sp.]